MGSLSGQMELEDSLHSTWGYVLAPLPGCKGEGASLGYLISQNDFRLGGIRNYPQPWL